ncbi:MAG: NlpC/P60 family protein [Candidatus Zixiibacteriota bacterium]|nr:MAG: NlpC/P60 family protein [candidate division Zixibacteria bacterium]
MKFLIIVILFFVIGCTPKTRYSNVTEERKEDISVQSFGLSTNQNIRLGSILQSYLGRPYAGKSKYEEGIDCSEFTMEVFKKYDNIRLPRTSKDQFNYGTKISKSSLKYGDLLFFRTDGNRISHVGIYLEKSKFIHVSSSHGVMISGIRGKYWNQRYVGARRVINLNNK